MQRLKEGSTWAGLAALFATLAQVAPHYAAVFQGLTAVSGVVAGMIPDTGAPK
jgi:hypothetical protein